MSSLVLVLLTPMFDTAIRAAVRILVGSVRTRDELGGLDVSIIDLSDIDPKGDAGHLKVGSSPELIAFIRRIRASGVKIFDDEQKLGLFDHGAVLRQSASGVVIGRVQQGGRQPAPKRCQAGN